MAFMNEYIPKADVEKYQTEFWSERARKGDIRWVMDRSREMYLIWLGHGSGDEVSQNRFLFYRQGRSFCVLIDLVGGEGYEPTDGLRTHYVLLDIGEFTEPDGRFPEALIPQREAIVAAFDEALNAFQTPPVIRDLAVKRNPRSWNTGWQTARPLNGRLVPTNQRFVNERIPKEDMDKYQIASWNHRFGCGNTTWAVDRERKIYLRLLGHGIEEDISRHRFFFYWNRYALRVVVDIVVGGGSEPTSPRSRHFTLLSIGDFNGNSYLFPEALEPQRDALLADLREALAAYREGGIYSESPSFTATFDF
jgi:hypothetical protein